MSFLKPEKQQKLLSEVNSRCGYCGDELNSDFEIDHVIPKSRGGIDLLYNLLPSCRRCNRIKSAGGLLELKDKLNMGIFYFEHLRLKKGGVVVKVSRPGEGIVVVPISMDPYYWWGLRKFPPEHFTIPGEER